MFWKLNRNKYQEVYVWLEQLKANANYVRDMNIVVDYLDFSYNGFAFSEKTIVLSRKLVGLYEVEPLPLKSLLAHEFAHIVNGDSPKQMKQDRKFDIHTARLVNIIKEIRAEIVGARLQGFTPAEINRAHNILREKNMSTRKIKEAYGYRYPSRTQIKYFAKRNGVLTPEIVEYFIKSYFKHFNIKDEALQADVRSRVLHRFGYQNPGQA